VWKNVWFDGLFAKEISGKQVKKAWVKKGSLG